MKCWTIGFFERERTDRGHLGVHAERVLILSFHFERCLLLQDVVGFEILDPIACRVE